MSRTTVRRWLSRFLLKRCDGLHDHPRSGRPTAITPATRALVVALAGELPAERTVPLSRYSLSELSVEVADRLETDDVALGHTVDHEPARAADALATVAVEGDGIPKTSTANNGARFRLAHSR